MSIEEAILRIQDHMRVHHIGEPPHIYIKEALDMAIVALQQQKEREKQPLTMAELRKMNGETAYCLELNTEVKIHSKEHGFIHVSYKFPGEYGELKAKDLTLYRIQTKEE